MSNVKQMYFFFVLFLCSNISYAQKNQLFELTDIEGLSSYNVQSICQDRYGYIWAGTQDGLNKFNGRNFIIYNKATNPRLSGNDIRCVLYDSTRNFLWICSTNGGVDALNAETEKIEFTLPIDTIKKYLPDPSVQKIVFINANCFSLNTPSGILFYDFKEKRVITGISQPFNKEIGSSKFVVGHGLINEVFVTVTSGNGVSIYNKNNLALLEEYPFPVNLKTALFYRCYFDIEKKSIFLCTTKGLFSFNLTDKSIKKISLDNDHLQVYCIVNMLPGLYLLGTTKGVFEYHQLGNELKKIDFASNNFNADWDINTNDIFLAKDREIFYAARKGLMIQSPHLSPFEKFTYDPFSNNKLNHLYYLHFIDSINILACDLENIYKVNLENGRISKTLNHGFYYYFFDDFFKKKFVSKDNGLFILESYEKANYVKAAKVYPELAEIENLKFNSHIILNDSILVLSAEEGKGIYIWNKRRKKVYSIFDKQNKPESKYCNGLAKVSSSVFLVATDSEVALYDVISETFKRITIVNAEKVAQRLFLDIAKIKNTYWVASYGAGIFILDSNFQQKKIINSNDGLSNNSIYKMILDNQNNVWVTTNYGLNKINATTLDIKNYFIKDGLHGNAFEEFSANIFNGIIIAGGPNGFTKIDPTKLYLRKRPAPCYFEYMELEDGNKRIRKQLLDTNLVVTIPNDIFNVDINVISINYDLASGLKYAYKIRELGDNWFSLGEKNIVSLIGFSPGTYHLQVKAANEDGAWNEPKELVLEFLPKWYQTWWFKLLVFLTTAGIIYAFYRYRIVQIKKQHEIRKNIATDLHDDLGSTLNSVKVFTNLAISGVKQEESLQQVKDNLNEATSGLRDMIWVLDDSLDTVDELVTRLKQFALPVAAASNIQAEIKAESEVNNLKLTKEEKRNLFLVCKEAINNSIKYSGASLITVDIKPVGKKIRIAITDNGKGFDEAIVKKGYGLKNMQYRARQIKYQVALNSVLNTGTQMTIQPL
jgi:ligand-binding sensor domain-containing protein